MQPHPDRGELKLYLRGFAPAPVANVIKQHLMVCDQCVSDALVEYDQLDRVRAAVTTPSNGRDNVDVTALIPAARATIVINRPQARLRYAWAALLPIAIAVGLAWTVSGREEASKLLAQLRTRPAVEPSQSSSLVPRPETPVSQPTPRLETGVASLTTEPPKPRANRRTRTTEDADSIQQEPAETRVARFYVVSARSNAGQPVLLQPVEAPAVKSESLHSSAALSLVMREPSLAPPPQRRGLKRVFSVLAAPFRKS
jgi:hypothetical protein